jgi:large subunit ribosomal protein L30
VTWAAVRIRSSIQVNQDIFETMIMMRLGRANHCVLLAETPQNLGMLRKAKDYITWGEVDPDTLAKVILARGEVSGGGRITEAHIKEGTKAKDAAELARKIIAGEAKLTDVTGAKPVIRLHPPVSGYEGVKRSFKAGGALGYRGKEINKLLLRMIKEVD